MTRVRTYSPAKNDIRRAWRVIDAEGETLGRLATRIAAILRGKDKPTYTMHMSVGDNVIVINAEKVRVTGQKESQKIYYRHTQYPGGLRAVTLSSMREKHPDRIIQKAVKGMLPHNRLGRQIMRRLHIYAGPDHPHMAQVRSGQGTASRRRTAHVEAQPPGEGAPIVPRRRRRRGSAAEASGEAMPPDVTTATTDTQDAQPDADSTTDDAHAEGETPSAAMSDGDADTQDAQPDADSATDDSNTDTRA